MNIPEFISKAPEKIKSKLVGFTFAFLLRAPGKTGNNREKRRVEKPNNESGQLQTEISVIVSIRRTQTQQFSNKKYSVFISYRRADSAYVMDSIYDKLATHFGEERIFSDVRSTPLSVDFRQHIDGVIADSEVMIVLIGRDWLSPQENETKRRIDNSKDMVRIEIESALEKRIPIIPVFVRGAEMPSEDELPLPLKELVYRSGISIRPYPDFDGDTDRLIEGLERILRS